MNLAPPKGIARDNCRIGGLRPPVLEHRASPTKEGFLPTTRPCGGPSFTRQDNPSTDRRFGRGRPCDRATRGTMRAPCRDCGRQDADFTVSCLAPGLIIKRYGEAVAQWSEQGTSSRQMPRTALLAIVIGRPTRYRANSPRLPKAAGGGKLGTETRTRRRRRWTPLRSRRCGSNK